jgi:hypothetical protein
MKRKNESPAGRCYSGPMRWEQLPPAVEARARELFYSCGKYLVPTFEQWEVGFCREESPEKELAAWKTIDAAFHRYFADRDLTPNLATEVVYQLMSISLGVKKCGPFYQELKRLYDA